MSVLDKLDGNKKKEGVPTTEQLIKLVNDRLEGNHVYAMRMCFPRPDAFQRKIAAMLEVREKTGASLAEAKRWVESHKLWTPEG